MNTSTLSIFAVAAVAGSAVAGTNIELTTNGDFEAGDTSGWQYFPSTNDTFAASMDNPSSGTWSGQLTNNAAPGNPVIKQANIGVGQVSAGQEVFISFDARGTLGPSGVIFAEFFSEVAGGGVSDAVLLGGAPVGISGDSSEWTTFNYTVMAGPDVSGGVTLQFGAITGAVSGATAEVFIDNVSVSIVPAPASAAMLGLGGLFAARRRR